MLKAAETPSCDVVHQRTAQLTPEVRSLIVARLAAALAASWRRQQEPSPERTDGA